MAEDYLVEKILGHLSLYKEEDFEEQVPIKIKKCNSNATEKCIKCGNPVYKKGTRCINCAILESRLVKNRPLREELKKLIREKSFVEIGKIYNVSDNAIRKWCDTYNLPRKKSEIKKYSNEEWILI